MCTDCGGICAVLDRLIEDYHRWLVDNGHTGRRYFHPMEIKGRTTQIDQASLAEFVEQASCIDLNSQELTAQLQERTGFPDAVSDWIQGRQVPNGFVRKIILTNAEKIVREHGAEPRLTLLMAA